MTFVCAISFLSKIPVISSSGELAQHLMNKTDFELSGLVIPVPAPFTESGAVDFGVFLAHLNWLAEGSV